ncbi:MAG: PEP-CTERM sorting domain-containing protein [Rhodoferax sp.]
MKRSLKSLFSLIALSSLTLASTQSLASTASVAEIGLNKGQSINLVLPIQSSAQNYTAGSLDITVNGTSFLAFCIDPFQYASHSALTYTSYSDLNTLGSSAAVVSNLYSQSYASTLGNATNSAAFQLALWDLAKDDGVLTTGGVHTTNSTNTTVAAAANSMIYNAQHSSGSTQYSFNLYTNGNKQDYLVASVTAVPEPETYAMLLAGLGLMGFTVRRRRQSAIGY